MIDVSKLKIIDSEQEDFDISLLDEFAVKEPCCLVVNDHRNWFDKMTGDLFYNWYGRQVKLRIYSTHVEAWFMEWNQQIRKTIPLLSFLHMSALLANGSYETDGNGDLFFRINPTWHKYPAYFRVNKRYAKLFRTIAVKGATAIFKSLTDAEKGSAAHLVGEVIRSGLKVYEDKNEALRLKAQAEERSKVLSKIGEVLERTLGDGNTEEVLKELDDSIKKDDDKKVLH